MKYVVTMMVLALFAGKMAVADNSASASVENTTSENPITGTVKHKSKKVQKHKDMAGNEHSKTTTKTKKVKTDGSSTTNTETEEHHD